MNKSRLGLALIAMVGSSALLVGCAVADDSEGSASGSLPVEILLPFPEGLPFTPLIVAREQGLFDDAGIDVTVSVADGSGYLSQQIVAGNVDFALMGAADAVVSYSKRDDVRVLFCNQVNNVYRIVAKADSGITAMEDLEGKSIGYTEPGGGESQLVAAAIAEAGLVENETITLVPVGSAGPQSLTALQNDTIQAYSSSFPDVAALAAEGIEWVDITPAKYSNVPGACMVTTEEVLSTEDGLEAAKALATAWVQAQYFAIENPEEAFEIVCAEIESACENRVAAEALYAEAIKLISPPDGQRPGELLESSWNTVVEILASSDTVPAGFDITPLIGGDNVEAVIAAAYEGH